MDRLDEGVADRGHQHRRSWPCSYDRPKATPEIVAERQQPGIDDLQSSSSAGLT
jgi:hypothetical protein